MHSVEGLRRLSALARRLQAIYGIAIAAEGALRHQAAEQDAEIADCLRVGVSDPARLEKLGLITAEQRTTRGGFTGTN
jgi:hypothetical protein